MDLITAVVTPLVNDISSALQGVNLLLIPVGLLLFTAGAMIRTALKGGK